jgi:glucosyl-3-phosphoglycerate phosphatase
MTRLLVVRHGRTGYNATDRIQGQLDTELDEVGRAEAVAVAARLAAVAPDVIVSSDLSRAADTAAELGAVTGLPVRYDPRLRERYFGVWQGLLGGEVAERYPEEYARWQAGLPIEGCEVEELDDLAKRASMAFAEAADLAPGGTVVVFCHGGTTKYGVVALLGWPGSVLGTIGSMGNCHWVDLRRHAVRGWRLHGYNVA